MPLVALKKVSSKVLGGASTEEAAAEVKTLLRQGLVQWIEATVGEPLFLSPTVKKEDAMVVIEEVSTTTYEEEELWLKLRNGVVLCKLVNKIKAGTIKAFNPCGNNNSQPLHAMNNLHIYLQALAELGVKQQFDVSAMSRHNDNNKKDAMILRLSELLRGVQALRVLSSSSGDNPNDLVITTNCVAADSDKGDDDDNNNNMGPTQDKNMNVESSGADGASVVDEVNLVEEGAEAMVVVVEEMESMEMGHNNNNGSGSDSGEGLLSSVEDAHALPPFSQKKKKRKMEVANMMANTQEGEGQRDEGDDGEDNQNALLWMWCRALRREVNDQQAQLELHKAKEKKNKSKRDAAKAAIAEAEAKTEAAEAAARDEEKARETAEEELQRLRREVAEMRAAATSASMKKEEQQPGCCCVLLAATKDAELQRLQSQFQQLQLDHMRQMSQLREEERQRRQSDDLSHDLILASKEAEIQWLRRREVLLLSKKATSQVEEAKAEEAKAKEEANAPSSFDQASKKEEQADAQGSFILALYPNHKDTCTGVATAATTPARQPLPPRGVAAVSPSTAAASSSLSYSPSSSLRFASFSPSPSFSSSPFTHKPEPSLREVLADTFERNRVLEEQMLQEERERRERNERRWPARLRAAVRRRGNHQEQERQLPFPGRRRRHSLFSFSFPL